MHLEHSLDEFVYTLARIPDIYEARLQQNLLKHNKTMEIRLGTGNVLS